MKKEKFVELIVDYLRWSAVENVKENLSEPPGRYPNQQDLMLSNWYKEKSEDDRKNIDLIVQESIDEAIFGFFCILDGVRKIVPNNGEGHFVLKYLLDSKEFSLNNEEEDYLHDIYKELIDNK